MIQRVRFGLAAALLVSAAALLARSSPPPSPSAAPSPFGDAFWRHWGDGKGELSGYDLTIPRYGEIRHGIAVTVFVTETFANSLRVKSDPGRRAASDEFPVLKLNLVEDFSTGIYDYHLLTSAFVALTPVNGRAAGAPTKVAFSSQEWCGGLWSQLLFDAGSARWTLHSYFDGEADQSKTLPVPADAISGDTLLLWARGLAAPFVEPGEKREVPYLRSVENARLQHKAIDVMRATLSREKGTERITVPAGTFEVMRARVSIAGGSTWTFAVETAAPHRIVQWETTDGEKASLLGSDRLEYWNLHGNGQESYLARLGLKPRPPRTP
jgi:hypothetical protein